MSWLARSIANSLKLDEHGGDDDDENNAENDSSKSPLNPQLPNQDSPSASPTATSSPRGVKEDLTDLTKTITRQFWGVASFLAPPPQSDQQPSSHPLPDPDDRDGDDNDDDELIAGIRSDFAEIGGKVKSGISKLSSNKTVSEITKIASNFLQFGSEGNLADADLVGVTEEVVAFARDISMHPQTWIDFPIPENVEIEEFDMSDAQQEHALAVERLAPRLAALRIELCPGYMSEGRFWKIYFVLLHPRLTKHDAELLSTPQIMEARAMLSHESQNKARANRNPGSAGTGLSVSNVSADVPHEESLSLPSCAEHESVPLKTSDIQEAPPIIAGKASGNESGSSRVGAELETEKHPVQSTEMQIIDKTMVEEQPVNQTKNQHSSSSSSSRLVDEKFEDDGDDWLKDDSSEMAGPSGTAMPPGNDEDVSFSDLEDDDEDVPTSHKKVISGSGSPMKDSRDWVHLSKISADSVKDINPVGIKRPGSGQVSAKNSETKESNDWLDLDDIEVM